jgi:hypothetical protein
MLQGESKGEAKTALPREKYVCFRTQIVIRGMRMAYSSNCLFPVDHGHQSERLMVQWARGVLLCC